MLRKAIPVLPSTNLRNTIDFYQHRLGFKGHSYGSYAILTTGEVELRFVLTQAGTVFQPVTCFIYVDNVEDLYAQFSAQEIVPFSGALGSVRHGLRSFSIRDNDGNELQFGEKK